jgi:hypothetical protein
MSVVLSGTVLCVSWLDGDATNVEKYRGLGRGSWSSSNPVTDTGFFDGRERPDMSKWLQSGLRRDICVVVASEGDPTKQSVKRAVEVKNDDRIRPKRFNSAVEKLDSAGILDREADGVHDRLVLTDAGQERLEAHYEWVNERLA